MKKLIGNHKIKKHAKNVAAAIEKDYTIRSLHKGKYNRPLVLVGVMNGALPFLMEVAQNIPEDISVVLDTVKCGSYTGMFKKGKFKLTKMPDNNLSGCHVVILDDIIDTGETMIELVKRFEKKYKDCLVQTGALLKREGTAFRANYLGQQVRKGLWLVGYGLDDNGAKRNYKDIYVK